jgi:hypothetical protein
MLRFFSKFLDVLSEYFAHRKGLLPLTGIVLILINALLQFYPGGGLLAETNFLLHLGVIIAILGIMLAWAL